MEESLFPTTMDALFDYPVTFVTCNNSRDIHVFVPETFDWILVQDIANNFTRTIQQQVKVYHDFSKKKLRLCPMPDNATADTSGYGMLLSTCDMSEPKSLDRAKAMAEKSQKTPASSSERTDKHIPRPPNSWILFRQAKSRELNRENPGATASELSTIIAKMWREARPEIREFWQTRAQEEDRLHKQMYPGYKYTARKSAKNGIFGLKQLNSSSTAPEANAAELSAAKLQARCASISSRWPCGCRAEASV